MIRSGFAVLTLATCVLAIPSAQQPSRAYLQKSRTIHTAEEFARLTGGKVRIRRQLDPERHAALREALPQLPVTSFTAIVSVVVEMSPSASRIV